MTPARIGSAAAVLRRVVEGSTRHGADRALDDGKITVVRPRLSSRPRGTRLPIHHHTTFFCQFRTAEGDLSAQERATVSGGTPFWRSLIPTPTLGLCW